MGDVSVMFVYGLRNLLSALLRAQFSMRMQKATQQLTNSTALRNVGRDIARVRTLITERAGQK